VGRFFIYRKIGVRFVNYKPQFPKPKSQISSPMLRTEGSGRNPEFAVPKHCCPVKLSSIGLRKMAIKKIACQAVFFATRKREPALSEPAELFQEMQPGSEFGGDKLGMQFFAIFLQP
jgi:hypothetical protein